MSRDHRCLVLPVVDVGRTAGQRSLADRGVFHQIVFQVHDRPGAADEQDGIAVVQPAHLVRRQQFPTADLHVGGPGTGLALGFPVGLGVDGRFAQGLGDVLVGAGLY